MVFSLESVSVQGIEITVVATMAFFQLRVRRGPRRNAANRCYNRMHQIQNIEEDVKSHFEYHRSNIPLYEDAYFFPGPISAIRSDVGDYNTGQLIIGSIPFKDHENGDFVTHAIFANETKDVILTSSVNLMVDDPGYLAYVISNEAKFGDTGTQIIQAYNDHMFKKNNDDDTKAFVADQCDEKGNENDGIDNDNDGNIDGKSEIWSISNSGTVISLNYRF